MSKLDESLVENDFKVLFQEINTLRQTITEMLIENKSNGLTQQMFTTQFFGLMKIKTKKKI